MNFSSSIMNGMGISLGGLEIATDFLYANTDLYEPELTDVKTNISHKVCKPVTATKPVRPKVSKQGIINKFSLIAVKTTVTSSDEIIDTNDLVQDIDDFDFSFEFDDKPKKIEIVTTQDKQQETEIENNDIAANQLMQRIANMNNKEEDIFGLDDIEDIEDDADNDLYMPEEDEDESENTDGFEDDFDIDSLFGDEDTDETKEADFPNIDSQHPVEEDDEDNDELDLDILAANSAKKIEEQKKAEEEKQKQLQEQQKQKEQSQQNTDEDDDILDSLDDLYGDDEEEPEDDLLSDLDSLGEDEEEPEDFDFDIDGDDEPEEDEDEFDIDSLIASTPAPKTVTTQNQQPVQQTQSVQQVQYIQQPQPVQQVQQNKHVQQQHSQSQIVQQPRQVTQATQQKQVVKQVVNTAENVLNNNKQSDIMQKQLEEMQRQNAEMMRQMNELKAQLNRKDASENALNVKSKNVKKDLIENMIENDTLEVDNKQKEYDRYSGMQVDVLFKEVKEFMHNLGVQKKMVDVAVLNEKFGAQNIKKLVDKSYIIRIGKGATIGR